MATFQGNYKSILGGVSEQVYTERQASQVSEQINMVSDTVRGLRKRPGTRTELDVTSTDNSTWSLGNRGHIRQYTANLGWGITTFLVNTLTGVVTSIVETATVQILGQQDYLIADDPTSVTFATVGSTLYVANSEVLPVTITDETRKDPQLRGFFYVIAGAYSKTFQFTVSTNAGSFVIQYETPSATSSDYAAGQTTPEYICGQLTTAAQAQAAAGTYGFNFVTQNGAYMYMECAEGYGPLSITTSTGQSYALASNTNTVDATTKLPAQLAPEGDGMIMTVGDKSFKQYYQWDNSGSKWSECGVYGSPTSIDASTMPLAIQSTSTENQHEFVTQEWAGREAGDDDNNETPAFLDSSGTGITGLASFQGRLIIFSGPYISMSSSNPNYKNYFYRTTVSQTLDSDRIEFTSVSFSGAVFTYGVPFNSDLILISSEHQGVIPGRSSVLTPNNATAVLTSTYQMNPNVPPQVAGRSMYYSYPRSNSSFSVKEMLPSGYTELQYVSQDVTDHLPTYLEGGVLFSTSSTTNNIVVFGSTAASDTLYVNEYLWSGDSKVISSWHSWTFDGTLHAAWFVREVLHILIEKDSTMRMLTMSLRDSPDLSDAARFMPAMDYCMSMPVSYGDPLRPVVAFSNTNPLQYQLWNLIANSYSTNGNFDDIGVAVVTGQYIGASIGIRSIDTVNRTMTLQPGYGSSTVYVGVRFTSEFSPTPPSVRDNDGNYVDVNKMIIQHYTLTTRYTSEFDVTASDRGGTIYDGETFQSIGYASPELSAQQAALSARYKQKIRCGLDAETSSFTMASRTLGDLNIQGLGYIVNYNDLYRRM